MILWPSFLFADYQGPLLVPHLLKHPHSRFFLTCGSNRFTMYLLWHLHLIRNSSFA